MRGAPRAATTVPPIIMYLPLSLGYCQYSTLPLALVPPRELVGGCPYLLRALCILYISHLTRTTTQNF